MVAYFLGKKILYNVTTSNFKNEFLNGYNFINK